MIRLIAVVMVLGGLVAGTACSGEPPPSRQDVLVALTETVIVPQFQSVADEMNNLREALETLCASPSAENLRSARDAWRDARALDAVAGYVVRAGDGPAFPFAR